VLYYHVFEVCVCVLLTKQWLNDNSVDRGMVVRLPLGTHAGTEHLFCAEIVHPQEHCKRKKKTDMMCNTHKYFAYM